MGSCSLSSVVLLLSIDGFLVSLKRGRLSGGRGLEDLGFGEVTDLDKMIYTEKIEDVK